MNFGIGGCDGAFDMVCLMFRKKLEGLGGGRSACPNENADEACFGWTCDG